MGIRPTEPLEPAVPGLSCSALTRQVGVSRQGVHQAVKRGVLRRGADGLINPSIEPNKSWLGLHAEGMDWRGRHMTTYARPTGPKASKSTGPATTNGAEEDPEPDIAGEILACLYTGQDDHTRQLAMLTEIRDAQRRISEQLAEVNLRLRIQRDPFHAFTIEGARLVRQDEVARENVDAGFKPSPAPAGAQNRRRLR